MTESHNGKTSAVSFFKNRRLISWIIKDASVINLIVYFELLWGAAPTFVKLEFTHPHHKYIYNLIRVLKKHEVHL